MFFQLATLAAAVATATARTFVVYNGCPFTVWPALYTSAGPAPGIATGWQADAYTHVTFTVNQGWNGRIWARRNCNFANGATGPNTCQVGGCNGGLQCTQPGVPPVTLAEFNLASGQDWYDISNVDGSNLPMEIWSSASNCADPMCHFDLNSQCPSDLAVRDNNGNIIGCDSACYKYGRQTDCCSGSHNTPQTCPASGVDRYSYFHNNCPQAYAYAYDDQTALFTCPQSSNSDYTITFCPP